VHSAGPTAERLEALEELVVQKVIVSDILAYSDGAVTASWLIRGDGLISVRRGHAKVSQRHQAARTATVTLPPPAVLSARVDHERTVFWDAKRGLWNRVNPWSESTDHLHGRAMKAAQRLVAHSVGSEENLVRSREQAAGIIQRLYAELGWTVTVEWQAQPSQMPTEAESSSAEMAPREPPRQ